MRTESVFVRWVSLHSTQSAVPIKTQNLTLEALRSSL